MGSDTATIVPLQTTEFSFQNIYVYTLSINIWESDYEVTVECLIL